MATLKYTTREINGNYKIKVSGLFDGKKVNTLVGVSGFLKMVNDIELCNRLWTGRLPVWTTNFVASYAGESA